MLIEEKEAVSYVLKDFVKAWISLFLYPECPEKRMCRALQSHKADCSSVIVTKSTLRKAIQNIVCCLLWLILLLFYCCFFLLLMLFCYLKVDVLIYLNANTTWKEKKLEYAIYLGWSPFELPPRTYHISVKTQQNKEWRTFKMSYM